MVHDKSAYYVIKEGGLYMYLAIGVLLNMIGLGAIGSSFIVQKAEDKKRMPGYYTVAHISQLKPEKDRQKAKVEFTMNFKQYQVDTYFDLNDPGVRIHRDILIVYDPETGTVYNNPMKKYRNIQGALIIGGLFLVLSGILCCLAGISLVF